jgi:hypothetical protein
MVQLKYKSLVTKEIIDYYLFKIKDYEKQKKDLLSTVSKFDIRISTKPIIEEEQEDFYYKIWIWRRGTKKRAHIKLYNRLELLKKQEEQKESKTIEPSFRDILNRIRVYADVPEDFEEYCEISYRDPSDEISRTAHPRHLKRAETFKKFITNEEIRSIPFLPLDDEDENTNDSDFYDLEDEDDLIPLHGNSIFLNDKREYDKLKELKDTVEYYSKIVESYGYDPHTGDYDTHKFPITKDDKQKKTIEKDFDDYFQALEEYIDYVKQLIIKYDVKPTGNLVQRLTFRRYTNYENNNTISKQPQFPDFDFESIMVAVMLEDFPNQ